MTTEVIAIGSDLDTLDIYIYNKQGGVLTDVDDWQGDGTGTGISWVAKKPDGSTFQSSTLDDKVEKLSTGHFRVSGSSAIGAGSPVGYYTITWSFTVNAASNTATETFQVVSEPVSEFTENVVYTSVAKVERQLGVVSGYFTTSTLPTIAQVEEMILEAQSEIEQYTGHAWREIQVENEYYDWDRYRRLPFLRNVGPTSFFTGEGWPLPLRHREVRSFDTTEGDKLEVWNGATYDDYIADKSEQRGGGGDFYVDYDLGIVYFAQSIPTHGARRIRMTYRYGASQVPKDIQKATNYLVLGNMALMDDRSMLFPEGGGNIPLQNKMDLWERKAYEILDRRREHKAYHDTD